MSEAEDYNQPDDNLLAEAKAAFDAFDSDGSGFLELEELAHLCGSFGYHLTKDEVASVLKNLDKDDDSRVDFDEFWTWWSSTGQKIQPGLHARVLFARGSMYANRLFKETVDEKMNSNAATTLRLFGEVQNPKMGSIFEVNTDPDALAHVRTTDELKDCIVFELRGKTTCEDSTKFVLHLGDVLKESLLPLFPDSVADVKFTPTDDGVSMAIAIKPFAGVVFDSFMMAVSFLNNLKISFEAGFNFASLADVKTTITELINVEVAAHLAGTPFIPLVRRFPISSAMIRDLANKAMKTKITSDIAGLDAFMQGDDSAVIDAQQFMNELLATFAIPLIQSDGSVFSLGDVVSTMLPSLASSSASAVDQKLAPWTSLANISAAFKHFMKAYNLMIQRDFVDISALEVRMPNGLGMKLTMHRMCSQHVVGQFFDNLANLFETFTQALSGASGSSGAGNDQDEAGFGDQVGPEGAGNDDQAAEQEGGFEPYTGDDE